jgi:hypothetical protein
VRIIPILTAIGLLTVGAAVADATKVKSVNLEKMIEEADRIFIGTCVAAEEGSLPGSDIPITLYTFSVSERIKGAIGETLTIRQVGVRKPRIQGDEALVFRIPGMPVYQVGQEVVLFLAADSQLGLTSPVGLMQGAFTVEERDGRKMLQNGFQNGGLFNNLPPETSARKWGLTEEEAGLFSIQKGPMDHSTFIGVVKKMVTRP